MAFTSRVTARVLSVVILRGYATKVNNMKALKKAPSKKPAATQQKVTMATTCTPTGVKSPKRSPKAKSVTTAEVGKVKKIAQSKAEKQPAEKRMSAYQLFAKEQYPMVTGATMTEKFKAIGKLWKALPEVEKAKYTARSQGEEGLKKRSSSGYAMYAKENYANFQGSMEERSELLAENWKKMTAEEKAKYQSQPDAPTQSSAKRALTGYLLFVKEKMSGIKGNFADQIKQTAVEWKAMPAEKQNEYELKAKAL